MREFTLFSLEHYTYMIGYGLLALIWFLIPQLLKFKRSTIDKYAMITGYVMLIDKFFEMIYRHLYLGETVLDVLPFNLCNYTLVLAATMLIIRSKKMFGLVYFWSVGAILAILTPDTLYSFPNFQNISFFSTHYLIFFSLTYCFQYYGFRIEFKDLKGAFIYINIILVVLFFVNLLIGSNYMYLRTPAVGSPMESFGPWPYYIILLEVYGTISFVLMYLPFMIKRRFFK